MKSYALTVAAVAAVLTAGSLLADPAVPGAAPTTPKMALNFSAAPVAATLATPPMPSALVGVVTQAEFDEYVAYQRSLHDNPEFAALNAQILQKLSEVRQLQVRLRAVRARLLVANPKEQAIGAKIMRAMARPAPAATPKQ